MNKDCSIVAKVFVVWENRMYWDFLIVTANF